MDDLISRQAAIDVINQFQEQSDSDVVIGNLQAVKSVIQGLPSAEPEVILFGSGIKYSGTSNLPSKEPYIDEEIQKIQDMEQAQSQKAYELGNRMQWESGKTGKWYRPTGVMPPEQFGRHRCSECDGFAMHDWKHHKEQLTNFCPNCGARLEVEGIS